MAMREGELARVVGDLQRLVGAPIRGVWQPERQRVVVGIGDELLLLLPRGPDARMHTIASRTAQPDRPFSFQGAGRSWLRGPLTSLDKRPGDRVVDLVFGERRLHLRLTGRGGGLWLVDGDRVVAAYDGPAESLPDLPALPPRSEPPRFSPAPGEDWDLAARRWLGGQEEERELAELRGRAERAVSTDLGRRHRLKERLEADLDKASDAPRWRRYGDALAANLHLVRRGAPFATLEDLEEPGRMLEIPLDPERPPAASLDRLYGKARRLERVGDAVLRHLEEIDASIARLSAVRDEIPSAGAARLHEILGAAPPPRGRSTTTPWHTWTGPRGERVFVGRDAAGNRRLTFQHARGRDFWMHVRDRPGAHVVIPVEGDHVPPLELLLAAAQIALQAARVPDGAGADVQYTRVKHVRSIPGEAGRVVLHEEKVLHVRRDPGALLAWRRT